MITVHCDLDRGFLKVYDDTPLVAGFRPVRREVAAFKTPEDWQASRYAALITDSDTLDMITWFWIDLTEERKTKPVIRNG